MELTTECSSGVQPARLRRTQCPSCGDDRLHCLGDLPGPANRSWEFSTKPGRLYECLDCTMRFRLPMPTGDELHKQYESLSVHGRWEYGARVVWRDIRRILDSCPNRSVLDVGCFRGDFLASLGGDWRRFGIEPSEQARAAAEERGICVLGDRIESLEEHEFSGITLIDVIEHLPRPFEALQKLVKSLVPGGKLILFTGNTESLSWRLAGRPSVVSMGDVPPDVEFWVAAAPWPA